MTTIEVVMYPWQTVEDVEREQAEAEILADAEFQQWLDEVMADSGWLEADGQQPTAISQQPASMGELEFLAYAADQAEAQPAEKMLSFAEETLIWTLFAPRSGGWSAELLAGEVEVLPDWQREDYIGA